MAFLKSFQPHQAKIRAGKLDSKPVSMRHFVNGHSMEEPFPHGSRKFMAGMGCFWGAERRFWKTRGVIVTAVGYAGGSAPNPTYEEVCSGRTGHAEVVLVVYDPCQVSFAHLLSVFWEAHDPTQGMRQGNDIGTQYRSALYLYTEDQKHEAEVSRDQYQLQLSAGGYPPITTEILLAGEFYRAEDYHQQYLAKMPDGYCGLRGTGISCDYAPTRNTVSA